MRWARVLFVTAGLAVTGAIVGAVLGACVMGLYILSVQPRGEPASSLLWIGAFGGAFLGGLLAPTAGWLLMRHVPLGHALLQTTAGTFIGALAGLVADRFSRGDPGPIIFQSALLGFALAAIRLRLLKPAKAPAASNEGLK